MGKKVTISMPDGLLQLIDEEVSRGHTSRSALMREAVRLYLGEQSISRSKRGCAAITTAAPMMPATDSTASITLGRTYR